MDTSNPISLIISSLYYVIVIVLSFFSLFSVYILLRYGRNRSVSLAVCLIFALFYLTILQHSYSLLLGLSF